MSAPPALPVAVTVARKMVTRATSAAGAAGAAGTAGTAHTAGATDTGAADSGARTSGTARAARGGVIARAPRYPRRCRLRGRHRSR